MDGKNREFSLNSFEEIMAWIRRRMETRHVSIRKIGLKDCAPWRYDRETGEIRNDRGTFFRITGIRGTYPDGTVTEQPIILQKEIGFLGILCRKIRGTWHFLMQAKIEPGNINHVQISPTIQATKSNFTRQHGGAEPAYLSFFLHMKKEDILADQIQSEQSSRFLGKRNRNVILRTEEEIPETDSHRWMTLRQLKELMKYDNLINMDTRTVLSSLPYDMLTEGLGEYPEAYAASARAEDDGSRTELYLKMNDYKMFRAPRTGTVPLEALADWGYEDGVFRCRRTYPFEIIFCAIRIDGREVTRWNQPLFAATGEAVFGLICRERNGMLEVLVQLKPEIGCFDGIELGPAVQDEYGADRARDAVSDWFYARLEDGGRKLIDVVLSEEGGRFYHEQNRNVIMMADGEEPVPDAEKYCWTSVGLLNAMTRVNNCLNIQLRNLMILLAMYYR